MCYTGTMFNFQLIFRPEPSGGYTVLVPALPGCVTFGETLEEAQKMAKEVIELYLEDMKANGEEIVDDAHTFESRIQVAVA